MAKPYREGAVWSFRLRVQKEDIYRTGFVSEAAAREALNALQRAREAARQPAHDGPWRTPLADALRHYALERLGMLKGARQEANRINRYLRAAGGPLVRVEPVAGEAAPRGAEGKVIYWTVALEAAAPQRRIAQGLVAHRTRQGERAAGSDALRGRMGRTYMSDLSSHEIQSFLDRMAGEGAQAATIGLEHALLRRLFSYAKQTWNWPLANPACGLVLPRIDNARDRVLSNAEWRRICAAFAECDNPYVAPAVGLLLQTAMRASEAIVHARWKDYDSGRCVLTLNAGKTGRRTVPLAPGAVAILEDLRRWSAGRTAGQLVAHDRILPISYEALKAAWRRACERAGVEDVRLHDLRHTAATRFALELNGDVPMLKVITGHKTVGLLMRYVNIKPDDVVRRLHGRSLEEAGAPAGYSLPRQERGGLDLPVELPVNVTPLRRSA